MLERVGPVGLLLWCGFLLGVAFPLSKVSGAAGVPPMLWALLVSVGVSLPLLPVLVARGQLRLPRGRMVRYVVVSGAVTFALINLMIFALVPKIGAGQVGMMFALSPVATLAVSTLFGMKVPGPLGLLGIGLGMIGALMVAFGRGGVEGALLWSLVALLIPVVLAGGNVYRSLDWPEGADPMALAFWSHLVAIAILLIAMTVTGQGVPLYRLGDVPVAAAVQVAVAALTFPAYFRLQKLGGPVLLSQIGYVAAAVGLIGATLFLGERYGALSWAGALVTAFGIALTVLAQSGRSLPLPLGRATRARFWQG